MNVISLTNKVTNCYLVPIKDGWLLIDTGFPDTFSHLLQLLNQKSISAHEIDYILITHFHPDHAGLTQNFKDLGTKLIIHEDQFPYIQKLNTFYKKNSKANFRDIISNNTIVLSETDNSSFLKSIGIDGNLITTPGHSDDSVSLIIDDCCAFTGDLPALPLMQAYNDQVIEDSWKKIQKYHVKTIYPAHGETYQIN